MLASRNKAIEKATTVLYELSRDEHTRALYDSREKAKWDEQSRLHGAKTEGRIEGESRKALEIARNFLRIGLETQQIVEGTGLGSDVIEQLRQDLFMS